MKLKHYNEEMKKVIVLFCGYMFGDWVFEDILSALHEFHVVVVEAAGASSADIQGGSHFETVDWLHAYLSAKRIDNYFVAGHSMGGFVAQLYSHKYPSCVQGMILLGSCAPSQFRLSHRSDALPATRALFGLDKETFFKFATHNIFSTDLLSDEMSMAKLKEKFMEEFPVQEKCEEQIMAMGGLINWSSNESPIFACPTLVLMGRRDSIVAPDWSLALGNYLTGNCEFKIIDSSHMFMYEEPAETAAHIISWLARQA